MPPICRGAKPPSEVLRTLEQWGFREQIFNFGIFLSSPPKWLRIVNRGKQWGFWEQIFNFPNLLIAIPTDSGDFGSIFFNLPHFLLDILTNSGAFGSRFFNFQSSTFETCYTDKQWGLWEHIFQFSILLLAIPTNGGDFGSKFKRCASYPKLKVEAATPMAQLFVTFINSH